MTAEPVPIVRRAHRLVLAGLCAALAACSSAPPAPDWQMNAHAAAQKAVDAYLSGNTRVATIEFARARQETARTGQPALLARVVLLECAVRVASLEPGGCSAFDALREDAAPAEQAYARYLAGQLAPQDAPLLPAAQQAATTARPGSAAPVLAAVSDPLARLVAAGVLLQTGGADPQVMRQATDTASAQGWRRPLLAWLLLQAQRAEQAGDADAAARLHRRIRLVEQGGTLP
ncbi:MAG: hypothetical protein RBS27_08310 [Giesbergeria sp.]|jgi:hypothetical protein|nr:hypothetical protein [Giesbergeria sp.]